MKGEKAVEDIAAKFDYNKKDLQCTYFGEGMEICSNFKNPKEDKIERTEMNRNNK